MGKDMNDSDNGGRGRLVGPVWLAVATGGWWKAREIADATGLDQDGLHTCLNYMARHRYLERRVLAQNERSNTGAMGARERTEFSVGPTCMVPGGLTAQEVSQAVAGDR